MKEKKKGNSWMVKQEWNAKKYANNEKPNKEKERQKFKGLQVRRKNLIKEETKSNRKEFNCEICK